MAEYLITYSTKNKYGAGITGTYSKIVTKDSLKELMNKDEIVVSLIQELK